MRRVSLYVHVPFCTRRCSYCSFYHVQQIDANVVPYVDAVIREIHHSLGDATETRLNTIFIGGGTPSVLPVSQFARLLEVVAMYRDDATTEVTCELNPEDVTSELLAFLRSAGVNRISLGVQSMQPIPQKVLKRCSPEQNLAAMELVQREFDNVSFDVLLGVPGSSVAETTDTIVRLLERGPQHFSVYCLEPGGDMEHEVAKFLAAVDNDRAADEYRIVCQHMAAAGYRHYEVSNFARDGFESAHNRVYWDGGAYIGVGPGAHSFSEGRRFSNRPSLDRYLSAQGWSTAELRTDDPTDANAEVIEQLMLGLRTDRGLLAADVAAAESELQSFADEGWAVRERDRWRLTDEGFLLLNDIVLRVANALDPRAH